MKNIHPWPYICLTKMLEGVGDEVFYFCVGTIVSGVLLVRTVLYLVQLGREESTRNSMDGGQGQQGGRTRSRQHDCAICLGDASLAVETNCGHVYCGQCILEVWRRQSALQAVSCPYCRQRLTLLLPYFSQAVMCYGNNNLAS